MGKGGGVDDSVLIDESICSAFLKCLFFEMGDTHSSSSSSDSEVEDESISVWNVCLSLFVVGKL